MEQFFPLIILLLLVFVAWKFLKGLIKTIALVVVAAAAAFFVFGVMG